MEMPLDPDPDELYEEIHPADLVDATFEMVHVQVFWFNHFFPNRDSPPYSQLSFLPFRFFLFPLCWLGSFWSKIFFFLFFGKKKKKEKVTNSHNRWNCVECVRKFPSTSNFLLFLLLYWITGLHGIQNSPSLRSEDESVDVPFTIATSSNNLSRGRFIESEHQSSMLGTNDEGTSDCHTTNPQPELLRQIPENCILPDDEFETEGFYCSFDSCLIISMVFMTIFPHELIDFATVIYFSNFNVPKSFSQ